MQAAFATPVHPIPQASMASTEACKTLKVEHRPNEDHLVLEA